MNEMMVKTHLIITDTHEEYYVKWCGNIGDSKPKLKDNKPIFVIASKIGKVELNTVDTKFLEKIAKRMTVPKGKSGVTTDVARIYIKQIDNSEKLVGIVIHDHIKQFAPMYDRVYYK